MNDRHPWRRRPRAALLALAPAALALVLTGCGTVANPQGWAAPVVQGDVVYASRDAGKLGAYRLTGQERLWEFPTKEPKLELTGIYGTPVLQNDTLYITGYSGDVAAVSSRDGSERWRAKVGARVIGGFLVVSDLTVVGTDSGEVIALDRATGAERWRRKVGDQVWSTPISDGSTIFVTAMNGNVTALGLDGGERWQQQVAPAGIAGTPALRDGVLYVGSFDRRMYAVDTRSGERVWQSEPARNWFWTEPLVEGDTVFAGNMDGSMYAFDRRTGAERWRAEVGSPIRGRSAVVDGVLVVAADRGQIRGFRPATGEQAWQPITVEGQRLLADVVVTSAGALVSAEVGRKEHKLYRINAAEGALQEIALAAN
jgi:eukaryotic-like serine/threonine-protein kinase